MSKTLLQKAKELPDKKGVKSITDEEKELILGYLKGEISFSQARKTTGKSIHYIYVLVTRAVRQLLKEKRISIN